jgi:hypothetical protein
MGAHRELMYDAVNVGWGLTGSCWMGARWELLDGAATGDRTLPAGRCGATEWV